MGVDIRSIEPRQHEKATNKAGTSAIENGACPCLICTDENEGAAPYKNVASDRNVNDPI